MNSMNIKPAEVAGKIPEEWVKHPNLKQATQEHFAQSMENGSNVAWWHGMLGREVQLLVKRSGKNIESFSIHLRGRGLINAEPRYTMDIPLEDLPDILELVEYGLGNKVTINFSRNYHIDEFQIPSWARKILIHKLYVLISIITDNGDFVI